ncbi:MAG: hypothetical protein H6828_06290 [Planctomycetes bacterium]|nr:hypothetical protein [Planctomycetota bacterium]
MQVIEQLRKMEDERFLTIYTSLEQQGFGPLDGEVAKAMKFRPHAIKKLPMAQRAKRAKRILESKAQAELCYELFGSYLIKEHRDLVTGFLDLTGVEHQDGMIQNVEEARPAGDKVAAAVAELDGKFAPEDVTLYLSICAEQWPQVEEIQSVWAAR